MPQPAVEVVTRLAAGSPFMASAILQGLVESQALISESQSWKVDPQALDVVMMRWSANWAAKEFTRSLTEPI